ncbi:C6 zinc finger domain containing [Fusarium albosuccineum]|uniref:C6 zinc finger domain containing n=1 Tax=Fusarium albosuccineum TaxID=1237068 RepID=A0A8H4L2N7_9HYPO|nr:C6 zinc finger domain containing [Fusarium albosuccineum]
MDQTVNNQQGTTEPTVNESPIANSPSQDRRASDAQDRRMSDEWDASKVPPSRFQKRKGSIYATPGSRDGHVERNYADKYWSKMTEKNWGSK